MVVEAGSGKVVAGPLYGGEGMLIHDCDLRVGLRAKQGFDAVGHYGREDALLGLLARPGAAANGAVTAEPASFRPSSRARSSTSAGCGLTRGIRASSSCTD